MKKPAIILITCDELRKDALSCYGNQVIDTPNIDALAHSGLLCDSAYTTSPWCLPARCSILTGLYPHHSGAYSNFRPNPLSNGLPNLFTALKEGGYRTSLFGKCHFAPVPYGDTLPDVTLPYEKFKQYYQNLGLDYLALQDDKQVSVWFQDDYSKELEAAGHLKAYRDAVWNRDLAKVFPFPAPAKWHPDAWVGEKAADFLSQTSSEESNFCWVSFSGPHYPFDAPREYLSRVKKENLPAFVMKEGELDAPSRIHHRSYHGGGTIDGAGAARDRACKNFSSEYWERLRISYYANVALIDDAVGQIMRSVKARFGENYLVIFTADHGEMLGNHGVWGKHNCGYEDVLNIPFIINQPASPYRGFTDILLNSNDIVPTCLMAADIPCYPCDGISISTLLKTGGRDITFAEGEGFLCATDKKSKCIHIRQKDGEFTELHDMAADPREHENFAQHPAYQQTLADISLKMTDHFMRTVLP